MRATVGIVGAGIVGKLIGFELSNRGYEVFIFDRSHPTDSKGCSRAAAGMLAPFAELEKSEIAISALGERSLQLWPKIIEGLSKSVYFQQDGTLVVAHPHDRGELKRLQDVVLNKIPNREVMREVGGSEIAELEPDLGSRFSEGLFFPLEGQIAVRNVLKSLDVTLAQRGVKVLWGVEAQPGINEITVGSEKQRFDFVIDCRGLGAKENLPNLRGVRGEIISVKTRDVHLLRPVRLMHPRYPLYIVPRPYKHFLIGATSIESDDDKPMTVQSALELLSAAFVVHPGFAEATILELVVGCRPAFPDNLPKIIYQTGLIRINGLYRHGFLIAPAIVEFASQFLETGRVPEEGKAFFEEGC